MGWFEWIVEETVKSCKLALLGRSCFVLLLSFLIAGCPANLQDYTAAPSESGNIAYSVNGFTSSGEVDKKDAMKYAKNFAALMCADGGIVKRLDTMPATSGFVQILHWQAIIECNSNRQQDFRK